MSDRSESELVLEHLEYIRSVVDKIDDDMQVVKALARSGESRIAKRTDDISRPDALHH